MSVDPLQDRFRGTLLGLFIGDALGMPVEGWPRAVIRERFAHDRGRVREMCDARLGAGTYTDDTQMALALAEALLDGTAGAPGPGHDPDPDLDRIAARFAERYDPERGYGGNTRRILAGIRRGTPWRRVIEELRLPGGSWANGAAMRVAPVALAFYPDLERVAAAAERQAEVTGHDHPIGRFGARLQALAVLEALRRGAVGDEIRAGELVDRLASGAPEEFRGPLDWIREHAEGPERADPEVAVRMLGVGGRASASVPAALWAFLRYRSDPEAVIVEAVGLGGDTDTIGAMAGALTGAYHGASAFPERWLAALEDGRYGKTYAVELADRLYERTPD